MALNPREAAYRKSVAAERKAQGGIGGYVKNVVKEVKDVVKSNNRATEMSNTSGPGTDAEATRLRGIADRQVGQLAGAILQGRRYDKKGRQVK